MHKATSNENSWHIWISAELKRWPLAITIVIFVEYSVADAYMY
jgi:hypothetical protein